MWLKRPVNAASPNRSIHGRRRPTTFSGLQEISRPSGIIIMTIASSANHLYQLTDIIQRESEKMYRDGLPTESAELLVAVEIVRRIARQLDERYRMELMQASEDNK